MAQKIIICEGEIGIDLLQRPPLAGCIADGLEVTQVSGYSTRDNRQMCVVLLSEPTVQADGNSDGEVGGPQLSPGNEGSGSNSGSETEDNEGSGAEGNEETEGSETTTP